jgi:hypothetical protein
MTYLSRVLNLRHEPSQDLFSSARRGSGFQMSEYEAREAVVRARNAALQMPLNHLDAQRDRLGADGVDFFDEINPIQIAQQFLAIVGKAMFENGIERGDAIGQLVDFIQLLNVSRPLTSDRAAIAVARVIDILRNKQDNNGKFREFYHDPMTGRREEIRFQLVVGVQRDDGAEVYKLTAEGAKLLLLNWSAPLDVDMHALLVEQALKSGQFGRSLGHLELVKANAIAIASDLSDIERQLRRLSYDKGFDEELKGLIDKVEAQVATFQENHNRFKEAFDWARDATDIKAEERDALREAQARLSELFQITGKLKTLVRSVIREFKSLQNRLLAEIGLTVNVPDIRTDVLQRLVVLDERRLEAAAFSEVCFTAFVPVDTRRHFDPFTMLDRMRLEDSPEDGEDDEVVDLPIIVESYTPGEQIAAQTILDDFIVRHPEGVKLSAIYGAVVSDPDLDPRLRQCILHRAVLFDPGEDWRAIKTPMTDWLDNDYFESRDFVITRARAPQKEKDNARA